MSRCIASSLCIVLLASLALADGDGPSRKMNRSEAATFNALQGTIRAALPKTPANYTATFTGFDRKEVPEAIRPDEMLRMFFTATYTLNRDVREAQQKSAWMDKAKGTPEQQARRAALTARGEELTKARNSTRDRGEKDRIRADLKKVSAEANALDEEIAAQYLAWMRSGGAATASQNVDSALPPKELSIRIIVNQDVYVNDIAAPYKIQGIPLAYEQDDMCQDHGTSCVTVLLGSFDKEKRSSGSTRYTPRNPNPGVPTKARGMVLVVSGPKDRPEAAKDFLKKTDLAKLKTLVP